MLEELVRDYAAFLKLDLTNNFHIVQDVIDNMITRLEELTSVVQMIKAKNINCNTTITEDLCKYRSEIAILSKKIVILSDVILKLQGNIEVVEKQVEKAENDFGVSNDSKIKKMLKPFFIRNRESNFTQPAISYDKIELLSVMDSFKNDKT